MSERVGDGGGRRNGADRDGTQRPGVGAPLEANESGAEPPYRLAGMHGAGAGDIEPRGRVGFQGKGCFSYVSIKMETKRGM